MNLNLKCDGKKINLWQTPTRITSMLMVDKNGKVECFKCLRGNNAKRVLHAYIAWVWHRRYETHYKIKPDGTFDYEAHDDFVKWCSAEGDEHINKILELMKNSKKIEVWQM
jgi:hypothetical protein